MGEQEPLNPEGEGEKAGEGQEREREENFNLSHPELQEGEVWLTNTDRKFDYNLSYNRSFPYKTVRVGKTAYDIHGKILEGMYPVFVAREEFERVSAKS